MQTKPKAEAVAAAEAAVSRIGLRPVHAPQARDLLRMSAAVFDEWRMLLKLTFAPIDAVTFCAPMRRPLARSAPPNPARLVAPAILSPVSHAPEARDLLCISVATFYTWRRPPGLRTRRRRELVLRDAAGPDCRACSPARGAPE
jgi:hypothetical protein